MPESRREDLPKPFARLLNPGKQSFKDHKDVGEPDREETLQEGVIGALQEDARWVGQGEEAGRQIVGWHLAKKRRGG